ncbi:LysR family transcriptional regulator [Metabacillus sp. JX24]|uniref:LysR family transcriptional regulator n=1 Tax=Metabacillus sp. JX24 TaxID=3240759 RepID=UPI00351052C7
MNLNAMRQFVTVVQAGSVTGAAKELHISQPAISMQIRNLEKELGHTLFKARGRGIELTEAGEFIFQQAVKLFMAEEEAERKIEQYRRGITGNIRIFATNFAASYLMPGWIARYKRLYPEAGIQLFSGNTKSAIDKLMKNEIDFAVIASHSPLPDEADIVHLLDDELLFIVPCHHPLASKRAEFEDLIEEDFILRGEGSSTRSLVESLCQIKQVHLQKTPVQVERLEEAIGVVASGYGITLAPRMAISAYMHRGLVSVVQVNDLNLTRRIKLCKKKGNHFSPAVKNFMDFIENDCYKDC